jgi:hypothetical protein
VGASTYAAAGSAIAAAIAEGIGAWTFAAPGTAAGVGTATGVGASIAAAVGLAVGTSSAMGSSADNLFPVWFGGERMVGAWIDGVQIAAIHYDNERLWP